MTSKTPSPVSDLSISSLVANISDQILGQHTALDDLVLVGIVSKGVPIAKRIQQHILRKTGSKPPVGKLDITLFRDDLDRNQFVDIQETDIPCDLSKKNLILVNDVLHHGRMIRAALNALLDFGRPAKIELAVLLDRNEVEIPVFAHYVGERMQLETTDQLHVNLLEIDGEDKITHRADQSPN
ncbi:MAG: pyrimidine operon attenuation protein/uracil phosphoribosyltransferase [Candidatus Marinamargulisbacteria bacterium]|jgi:pyrimidine operon attenuation protein/uracil phosphoribosyltransferase